VGEIDADRARYRLERNKKKRSRLLRASTPSLEPGKFERVYRDDAAQRLIRTYPGELVWLDGTPLGPPGPTKLPAWRGEPRVRMQRFRRRLRKVYPGPEALAAGTWFVGWIAPPDSPRLKKRGRRGEN
jgi:hypothetical protein